MTSTEPEPVLTAELPSDLRDLYDVPRVPSPRPDRENDPVVAALRNVGRDLAVLVGLFVVCLTAFVVCVTLVSAGLGLAVLVGGLFLLLAGLVVAGWAARMSRLLLGYAGADLPPTHYPAPGPGRGRLRRLGHAQSWRDLLYVLVAFPLTVFSFSVAVSWVAGGLGGITYWFWSRWLPEDNQGLPYLLGFPGHLADVTVNTIAGVVLAATAPLVLRGLVRLHTAIALGLAVDETSELRQQVDDLNQSRTAAGDAEVHTLRRLERDLHDGPQQRLVRLGMDISAAQRRLEDDPGQARALLAGALEQSQEALAEIRGLSRGIAPPILAEQGLEPAVRALASRGSVATTVDVAPVRLTEAARNAAYFLVAEALTNVEKHSGAHSAAVEVRSIGALAVVNVTDDGVGGASTAKGHGLAGLVDRLAGVDGTLAVSSPTGGPTQLTATIPQQPR